MPDTSAMLPYDLVGHVALITGANHGIGAATARVLAECGARVLASYLRVSDPREPGTPEAYWRNRARGADEVLASIRSRGGRAVSLEADLSDVAAPARLFDFAETELGPVDILVNNATGWLADTFTGGERHPAGFEAARVSAATHDQQFSVDARGGGLMIAEFARRHVARQGRAGELHDVRGVRARALWRHGERRASAVGMWIRKVSCSRCPIGRSPL